MNVKRVSISDTRLVEKVLAKAAEVFNIPTATITGGRRYSDVQRVRMVIANLCRVEHKIHYTTIATVLNRDRSSIYYYESKHEGYYLTWRIYERSYDTLTQAMTENAKPTLNKCQLKRLIKEAGITSKRRGKCKIIIDSGTTSHTIKSDLYQFPKTIEIIKPILENYQHNLDIEI